MKFLSALSEMYLAVGVVSICHLNTLVIQMFVIQIYGYLQEFGNQMRQSFKTWKRNYTTEGFVLFVLEYLCIIPLTLPIHVSTSSTKNAVELLEQ